MKRYFALLVITASWFSGLGYAGEPESSRAKCSELGRKFSADFKKEYVTDFSLWENPEFHYSPALATCLVYTGIVDGQFQKAVNDIWYYRRITDIYTNKVLAYSRYFIGKKDSAKKPVLVNLGNVGDAANLPPEKFAATKTKLFSQ